MIADDHAVLRAGLRMMIGSQPDMEVVGESADGSEAVAKACELRPDVLVLDLTMPGVGGVKALGMLESSGCRIPVLVLSMHQDPAYVRTALTAGAAGYVAKRSADTDLLAGIRAVHAGRLYVDPSLAGAIGSGEVAGLPAKAPVGAPTGRLSGREAQVLRYLAQGHTNQEIADKLEISVKTAETYRARLGRKLGMKSRADFVRYGLETGLSNPSDVPAT